MIGARKDSNLRPQDSKTEDAPLAVMHRRAVDMSGERHCMIWVQPRVFDHYHDMARLILARRMARPPYTFSPLMALTTMARRQSPRPSPTQPSTLLSLGIPLPKSGTVEAEREPW